MEFKFFSRLNATRYNCAVKIRGRWSVSDKNAYCCPTKEFISYWLPTESLRMSQVNYSEMSKTQLKQYFLKHRGDKAAFQAYLDRINQCPLRIIASPSDSDFDEKVQSAIRQKLEAARNSSIQQFNTAPSPTDQE
jgi:hypothetical protein